MDGLDLVAELRERRWHRVLFAVDRLPNASYTRQAISNDDEHVEMILRASEGREQSSAPNLAEYDGIQARLDSLIDHTKVTQAILLRANGAKQVPKFRPEPRPQTAFERVAARRRSAKHQSVVARVMASKSWNRAQEQREAEQTVQDPLGLLDR